MQIGKLAPSPELEPVCSCVDQLCVGLVDQRVRPIGAAEARRKTHDGDPQLRAALVGLKWRGRALREGLCLPSILGPAEPNLGDNCHAVVPLPLLAYYTVALYCGHSDG